jgi:hypothetical protein
MATDEQFELPTWASLPARPNEVFDALARTVAVTLSVPIALVVLVSKGGQVFPGAVGLPPEMDARRSGPLSQSLSRQVAGSGRPLIVPDALADPVLRDHYTVHALGMRAYAGVPLLDGHGSPLGVLCAMDTRARPWSPQELQALGQVADHCSRQLQVHALELAEREARATAERAATAAQRTARAAQAAFQAAESEADRTRVVARLSTSLLSVDSFEDVLRVVDRLVRSPLGAGAAVVGLAEAGTELLQAHPTGPSSLSAHRMVLHLDDAHPLAVAAIERRVITVATREEADRLFPTARWLPDACHESALAVPLLLGQHTSCGALLLSWPTRRELDPELCTVATDLARHLAHTLDTVLLAAARQRLRHPLPAKATAALSRG